MLGPQVWAYDMGIREFCWKKGWPHRLKNNLVETGKEMAQQAQERLASFLLLMVTPLLARQ